MKLELKRIEAALQQAASQYLSMPDFPDVEREASRSSDMPGSHTNSRLPSNSLLAEELPPPLDTLFHSGLATPSIDLGPALPEFTASHESQHPFVALTNSALATNLLKDCQMKVSEWVAALEAVVQQIQGLYEEGPIVDGWLESFKPDGSFDTEARQVAIAKALKQSTSPQLPSLQTMPMPDAANNSVAGEVTTGGKTGYRLCGLSDDGQIWCRYCPNDQIPDVSLAIVRYQRLQTLLAHKHSLESRLGLLTEALVDVHGRVIEAES
ncbi:MAG: hypothetical protein IGS48_01595 [Oscillatoriales cyanobacterium C42_A2020_001]|nr:hypothetical protein [Leptolyngbyaceae cyanobacterium C42_A2020_001]